MNVALSGSWRCSVCGYVHVGHAPPDCCPVCGAAAAEFEAYAESASTPVAAPPPTGPWRCLNCDYLHEGAAPPPNCPVCGVGADSFESAATAAPPAMAASATGELRVVVIGGGIAGVAAAQAAVEAAPGAAVTLLSEESVLPYYRLNLTRLIAGDIVRDALPLYPAEWYREHRIALRTGTVVSRLDRAARLVELNDGKTIPYDALVLATGSHPFLPPLPGNDRAGVVALRTAADAEALLRRIERDPRCMVIGGGVLGLETAAALGSRGARVTLLESHPWLMPRQLNCVAAAILEAHLASLGVVVRKNARTREIVGGEAVAGILLEDGQTIAGTTVVMATGVRPNTALARKAGLAVDKGIVVDNRLRTSDPRIFAAGDAAEHNGVLYGTWAPSQYQGRIAGGNAAGLAMDFGGLPRANTLKVVGLELTSIGRFEPEDGSDLALASEHDSRFAHFLFRDGRMVGAILIGHAAAAPVVKRAIETGRSFAALLQARPGAQEVLDAMMEKTSEATTTATPIIRSSVMSTTDNLKEAFAGESQANRKYLAFAKKAEQDGFPQVARLFRAAAEAETVHAHAHLRVLGGIKDTATNLQAAIEGEGHEFRNMYPGFVAQAQAEKNKPAEISFKNALAVEEIHHGLYSAALAAVKGGKDLPPQKIYVCGVCGNTVGGQVPEKCPVCGVGKDKFAEIA